MNRADKSNRAGDGDIGTQSQVAQTRGISGVCLGVILLFVVLSALAVFVGVSLRRRQQ